MNKIVSLLVVVMLIPACLAEAGSPVLPNPGFEEITVRSAGEPELAKQKNIGWKFTVPLDWPVGWNPSEVSNVTAAVSRDKPHSGRNCLLLWGQSGSNGYVGANVRGLEKAVYKVSFYGRGQGNATLMTPSVHLVLNGGMTGKWAHYSGIFENTASVGETSLSLQALGAPVWFDDLSIEKCDALEEMRVREETVLLSKRALLSAGARADTAGFTGNMNKITQAISRLQKPRRGGSHSGELRGNRTAQDTGRCAEAVFHSHG